MIGFRSSSKRLLRSIMFCLVMILAGGAAKANACDYYYHHIAVFGGHVWWATVCMNGGSPVETTYVMLDAGLWQ